ncbi:MAG: glycosyltransferase, partial [Polyangia bacterium]
MERLSRAPASPRALTVLQVAYPFAPVSVDAVGGAEQILAALDAALVGRGHLSLVVACAGSRVRGTLFEVPAVPGVIDARARAAIHLAVRAAIDRALATHAVDVIHLHGIDFTEYLPAAAPLIVTLHLPLAWYPPGALDARARYVCVSESQRRTCPAAAQVIENGVAISAGRVRSRGAGYALALGRICPEKNFELA